MTREEALEYLNLPGKSSEQLVRKRYLELHRDYQKAISNAPSDHFRMLYRENLEKIEEAYLIMKQSAPHVSPELAAGVDNQIQQSLDQAQQLVDRFLNNGTVDLDPESESKINKYIEEISQLQNYLLQEKSSDLTPEVTTAPAEASSLTPNIARPTSPDTENQRSASSTEHAVNPNPVKKKNQAPQKETASADSQPETSEVKPVESNEKKPQRAKTQVRKRSQNARSGSILRRTRMAQRQSYTRLLMVAILLTLLSTTGGLMYTMYPIFFPEENTEQELVDQAPSEASIQRIVGDEFFRTGNYLEALVQYTLAISDEPESQYLKQRIDSCKVFLSQSRLLSLDQLSVEPQTPADQPEEESSRASPVSAPVNSANRFRGEEPSEQQAETGSQWSDDNGVNEQIVNSARSAQLSDSTQDAPFDSSSLSSAVNLANEESAVDEVKNFVDVLPEPLGGYEQFAKFTSRKIRYPSAAYQANVSGMVIVQFVVRKNGSISDASVVKGIGYGCDEEALRVVQLYQGWTPGKLAGKTVDTRVAVPIYFKLVN